ncbi:MAG: metallophosphoesterase [Synechococcaceae cyanobacterium]|nr:metallophosphoesterase [Synechococcaceae cyanobacterium]
MSPRSRRKRHWVIGDVHGCALALSELLRRLPPDDRLIFCGDVINRGPRIEAAMELVWDLVQQDRAIWLMGNHEQALADGLRLGTWQAQRCLAGCDTYRQLGDRGARRWLPRLASLPLAYWGRGWVATHAGLDPLTWRPDLAIRTPFWDAYDGRFGDVIVGHTPSQGVRRRGRHIVLIDSGACYGGQLSAYCPETGAVEQVPGLTGIPVSSLPQHPAFASSGPTPLPSLAGPRLG